jgi:hypothetical protein
MGNLFSRNKEQQVIINEDDQFFDCLNDDEPHEQNIENHIQTISHYYAVWIPSNVETTGKKKEMFQFYKHQIFL